MRAFLNVSLGRMRFVMGPLSWLSHLPILGRVPLAPVGSSIWSAVGVAVATTASGIAGTHAPAADAQARAPIVRPTAVADPAKPAKTKASDAKNKAKVKIAAIRLPETTTPTPEVEEPEEPAKSEPPAAGEPAAAPPEVPAEELPPLTPKPASTTPDPAPKPAPVPAPVVPEAVPEPEPVVVAPVAPVPNHAPSFTAGANRTVLEDAGPTAVAGWASDISPGPFEGGQTVTFVADADDPSLFTTQPAISPAGTMSFTPASDAHGVATVTVYAKDDGGIADGGADTSTSRTVTITILSANDAPSFVAGAPQVVLEDAGARVVPGWASAISPGPADESSQSVSFSTANDNPALFTAQPAVSPAGTLTYTPRANANGTATVTVNAFDDGGTTNGGVDASAPQTFTITITSVNDAPSFTAGADQSVLEDSGAASVSGWATGISAGPANESGQSVSFTTSTTNAPLFSAQPAISPAGTLTFTPAAGAHGVATITVRAVDDGGTADGGNDTSTAQTFVITVVAPNRAPSFTAGSSPNVFEDSGATTLSGWASGISAGPSWESGQSVSFTVSNSAPALFSAQPAVSASGTLSFVPAANANGTATVTVRAVDNGGTANGGSDTSAPQTFSITVVPVNDVPSFNAGGGASTFVNSSQQTIPGWATGISPGPSNESGQSVSFLVSNDNPGLFSSQPQVAPDGTLTYTPAALALGSANVTVRIMDDGGTANGGVDTSAGQTITITVIF